jgi:gas vesicle protein
MKKTTQNKEVNNKKGVSSVMTAVAGAVVGAGIAVVGAIVVANKNNQRKVKEVANNIKNQVEDKKDQVEGKMKKLEVIAKNAIDKVKKI